MTTNYKTISQVAVELLEKDPIGQTQISNYILLLIKIVTNESNISNYIYTTFNTDISISYSFTSYLNYTN